MLIGKRTYLLVGGVLAIALAVAGATQWADSRGVTVPAGTPLHVRLDNALSSNQNRPGDTFTATVGEPVVVNGKTVVPKGATAEGRVVDVRESGRLRGVARMQIELTSVEVGGNRYDIQTTDAARRGHNHNKRNLYSIGGGAAGGMLIGGLAAGGKGVLIGGPIGAGAGLTYALITGKKDIHLPAETRLTFELAQPVTMKTVG